MPRNGNGIGYHPRMPPRLLLAALTLATLSPAQQGAWSSIPTDPGAPRWTQGLMTFDRARGRTVLVNGSDVWEGAGTTWRLAASVPNTPGTGGGFTYDRVRQRALWFGGFFFFSNQLLEWDGSGWHVITTAHAPPPRADTAMVYDAARARTVLVGGWTGSAYLADTWEFDGVDWQQAFPLASPPGMSRHRMAYDIARGEVVLYSNHNQQVGSWLYNGVTWRQTPPGPPAMTSPAMVYDEARARTVLASSSTFNNVPMSTWEWDGTTWTNVQPLGPVANFTINGAYDSVRNAVVLAASDGAGLTTLVWNGSQWLRGTPFGRLRSTPGIAASYHAPSRATIVFGGDLGSFGQYSNALLEYRRSGWQLLAPATTPGARGYAAMATDPSGDVLLMGGRNLSALNDTWRWNGTTWTQLAPANSPTPRSQHAMATDRGRSRIVLFGGQDAAATPLADTWEWDGTTWNQRTTANAPSPRVNTAMTYDALRGHTLLFGGGSSTTLFTDDLWQWDGVNWTQRATAVHPAARGGGQFTFDPNGGVAVLTGGFYYHSLGVYAVVGDAWTWDGTNWALIAGTTPTFDVNGIAVYHEELGSTVYSTGAAVFTPGGDYEFAFGSVAAVTAFGSGCAGAAGVPELTALSVPRADNSQFGFWLTNARAGSLTFVGFDWTTTTIPLGNGCTALVPAPVFSTAVTNAAGSALVPFPIPPNPTLHGLVLFGQGITLEPGGALFGLGALTAGLRIVLS